jgi:hypothetical protein
MRLMNVLSTDFEPHSMTQPSEKINPLSGFSAEPSPTTTNLGGSRLVEAALNDLF